MSQPWGKQGINPTQTSWQDPRQKAMHQIARLPANQNWVEGVKRALEGLTPAP